ASSSARSARRRSTSSARSASSAAKRSSTYAPRPTRAASTADREQKKAPGGAPGALARKGERNLGEGPLWRAQKWSARQSGVQTPEWGLSPELLRRGLCCSGAGVVTPRV